MPAADWLLRERAALQAAVTRGFRCRAEWGTPSDVGGEVSPAAADETRISEALWARTHRPAGDRADSARGLWSAGGLTLCACAGVPRGWRALRAWVCARARGGPRGVCEAGEGSRLGRPATSVCGLEPIPPSACCRGSCRAGKWLWEKRGLFPHSLQEQPSESLPGHSRVP